MLFGYVPFIIGVAAILITLRSIWRILDSRTLPNEKITKILMELVKLALFIAVVFFIYRMSSSITDMRG
ncbi:MAG: hypothetical protein Q4A82_02670 [Corynebacterium sp.]|nr:hypothetical protein [Corynebacterium sp.]